MSSFLINDKVLLIKSKSSSYLLFSFANKYFKNSGKNSLKSCIFSSLIWLIFIKEKSLFDTLEACEELYARGYRISNVDLYKSLSTEFRSDPDDVKTIIPPFTVIDGLGANVARSIETARSEAEFLSKEDLEKRTQLSGTLIKKLDAMGVLEGLQDLNQLSLF